MSICLRRREFIAGLGGAAAWPLAARSQQPLAMPVIGVLGSGSRSTFEFALPAFAQGLRQQGYVEDRNVSIQYSWADGHYDLLPSMASEFVRRRVAVIVTFQGTATAEAAKSATSTIPVVFYIGTDPIAAGLVAALNRPGGNLTGATDLGVELSAKSLELLHDLLPSVTRIDALTNPANPTPENARLLHGVWD
jgi:putative ABC transport system substrate-binding protein